LLLSLRELNLVSLQTLFQVNFHLLKQIFYLSINFFVLSCLFNYFEFSMDFDFFAIIFCQDFLLRLICSFLEVKFLIK
jgi:hypothetical protein